MTSLTPESNSPSATPSTLSMPAPTAPAATPVTERTSSSLLASLPAQRGTQSSAGKRSRLPLLIGAAVMALLAVVALVFALGQRVSPEQVAGDYLAALESGDNAAAVDLLRLDPSMDATLLKQPILSAEGVQTITDVELGEGTDSGDATGFTASYTLAGAPSTVELQVVPAGKKFGLFTRYEVVSSFGSVNAPSDLIGIEVAGVPVTKTEQGLPVFPAVYPTEVASGPFTAQPGTVAVGSAETITPSFTYSLSQQGEQAVREAIDAEMARCLTKDNLEFTDCPFPRKSGLIFLIDDFATVNLSIVKPATYDLQVDGSDEVTIVAKTDGVVSVKGQYRPRFAMPTLVDENRPYRMVGVARFTTDGQVNVFLDETVIESDEPEFIF